MTLDDLQRIEAPFTVESVHDGSLSKVVGFSETDPLGVGGYMDIIPDEAVAYFESGGWVLVSDLMEHWDLHNPAKSKSNAS